MAAISIIHHFVVPWLLVPVFGFGFMAGALCLEDYSKLTKSSDRILGWCLGGLCVLGTLATIFAIRWLRRRPAHWRLLQLGRGAWIFLFSLAWLAGVGFALFISAD
jgi:Na+/H+ antiporter NhaA